MSVHQEIEAEELVDVYDLIREDIAWNEDIGRSDKVREESVIPLEYKEKSYEIYRVLVLEDDLYVSCKEGTIL